jgi:two-component system sensor histidine kinase DesK
MRILPDDKDIGWLPYAYLVYLSLFLTTPLATHAGTASWIWTAVGVGAFLPLYFRSYWLEGSKLLWTVAGLAALGAAFAPFNAGASVFFVYAAAAAAFHGSPNVSWMAIAVIVAVVGVEAFALRLPGWFWIPAIVFSVFVGATNIHVAQRKIANTQLRIAHEEIERLAKVAERERIARDLHDLLGHTLSLIVLKSELAGKLLEVDVTRARREIRDLEQVSRNALSEVRQAVRGYREGDLASELARAYATLETAGVAVECNAPPRGLPQTTENVMALALREGVTNVVRHAKATRCTIKIVICDGVCELEIADDGCGGSAKEGIGLRGMRERLQSVSGSVRREIHNGGSTLIISVPASLEVYSR